MIYTTKLLDAMDETLSNELGTTVFSVRYKHGGKRRQIPNAGYSLRAYRETKSDFDKVQAKYHKYMLRTVDGFWDEQDDTTYITIEAYSEREYLELQEMLTEL